MTLSIVKTPAITGGVDTHSGTHVAAALDGIGGHARRSAEPTDLHPWHPIPLIWSYAVGYRRRDGFGRIRNELHQMQIGCGAVQEALGESAISAEGGLASHPAAFRCVATGGPDRLPG